jgi:hypothetical protein
MNYKTNLTLFNLDYSPIQSNSWLAGFIDADANFYFNWLFDKKGLPTSLQYYLRITKEMNIIVREQTIYLGYPFLM